VKPFVMFGHNHMFGDFLDLVHANGGRLRTVVQNVPEPVHPGRKTLHERLQFVLDPCSPERRPYEIAVQSIDSFVPHPGDQYLIGFTGHKMSPLTAMLRSNFSIVCEPLIHPTAYVSPTVCPGVIIDARAIVSSGVILGEHVIVHKGVIIGHDTVAEDYAVIRPGARIAGHVRIGYGAVVGMGATVIEDLAVGAYCVVAAGAVVIRDVEENTMVAGVPAVRKKLEQN
jgi:serine acetyltransferase